MSVTTHSFELGSHTYHLETGYFANQADGSVLGTVNDCGSAVVWDKTLNRKCFFHCVLTILTNIMQVGECQVVS